jgi:L-asparaginase
MKETATHLKERIRDKLIIITGAMRPERFSNSDAAINVGCAIATANLMENGVFIAMHGVVKMETEIKRDLETGKYY